MMVLFFTNEIYLLDVGVVKSGWANYQISTVMYQDEKNCPAICSKFKQLHEEKNDHYDEKKT